MIKTSELSKIFKTDEIETTALNKINLEDCTLHSASIADLPEGIVTVSDETIYVFNGEVIFKGILTDNSFIEQEVLPIPDYYWLYMSWDELLYNPANENFIAVDTNPFQIQAGFFKYNELYDTRMVYS